MKHFAEETGYEIDMFHYRHVLKRGASHRSERNITASKKAYRRRERRVLQRMLDDEVAAELSGYVEAECAYWWREFVECGCTFEDVLDAEAYLRESGQWTESHTAIFARAYRELRNRSEKAYGEWFSLAA